MARGEHAQATDQVREPAAAKAPRPCPSLWTALRSTRVGCPAALTLAFLKRWSTGSIDRDCRSAPGALLTLAELPGCFVAVHAGHLAVHQDRVEAFGGERSEGFCAVADDLDATAAAFEDPRGDDRVDLAARGQCASAPTTRSICPVAAADSQGVNRSCCRRFAQAFVSGFSRAA